MEQHTFVIPVYEESPFLEECILSLKHQTRTSPIFITTSTPSAYSRTLASKYGIPYIINEHKKAGIGADWNFALSQANSRFVTLAHQDNIYERGYAETVMNALAKYSHLPILLAFTGYSDLIEGRLRVFSLNHLVKKLLLLPFYIKPAIQSKKIKKGMLLWGNPIGCPTVTLNKEQLESFTFSSDYNYTVDWHAWLQLANREEAFLYINKNLMQHRIHLESETSRQISTGQRKKEEQKIFEGIWGRKMARFLSWVYSLGQKDNQFTD